MSGTATPHTLHPSLRDRQRSAIAFAGVLVVLCWTAIVVRGEIIDRILAVVGGQVISLSDVRAAIDFGLVRIEPAADQTSVTLDALIERELMLVEVRRYVPPDPPEAAVDETLRAIRARFPTVEKFDEAMSGSGLDEEKFREWIRDDLRVKAYLDERFTNAAMPAEDEVDAYLREHRDELALDGRSIDAARDIARQRLTNERRTAAIREWVEGLRRRADIIELYSTTS